MVIPLISTKYQIPPARAHLVDRGLLLQKMIDGFNQAKRLILVCAPAGYGKTTLVSEWANRINQNYVDDFSVTRTDRPPTRAAWLTCDPQDNDIARFLSYLIAALQQIYPLQGLNLLESFHAAKPPTPENVGTLLINELAEIQYPFVVVLDDLHTISAAAVYEFLTFLIEHQPPKMCLVLVTRADPALSLARFRGRGQIIEIRQDELAFSHAESTDFLTRTMDVALTEDQLTSLEKRTEGWVAGLQLAGLTLQMVKNIPAFIETFSGSYEYIADYLTDEVLANQSGFINSFLLQTSILDQLSAPLCTALTGEQNAQEILETLKEKNLFLVSLDQEKTWYRYHTLFADLLRNRLQQINGNLCDDLHLRACRWFQENGLFTSAIEHALAGHDAEQAAILIENAIETVFVNGQVMTMLRWLEAVPDEIKNRHLLLWIYHGLGLIWLGKSSAPVRSNLLDLVPRFTTQGFLGEVNTLLALFAMTGGNTTEADQLAQNALKKLPEDRAIFRCLAADTLGMTKILQCETQAAIQAFEQIVQIASQAGYVIFEIMALSHLAGLRYQQGQLHSASIGYQRALDLANNKLGKKSPVIAHILLGLGEVVREWNDLDSALRYFSEAAEMYGQFSEIGVPIAYLSIARVQAAQGDWKSGQDYLDKAREYSQSSKATRLNDQLVEALQARFWIAMGEYALAEQWVQEKSLIKRPLSEIINTSGRNAAGSELFQTDYLTLARLYLAQNKLESTLQVIDPLLKVANELGYKRRAIHLLVVKALALQNKSEKESAVEVLGQALALAEPEGYRQVFLEEGGPMRQLLYLAVAHGFSPAYAKDLLARFKQKTSQPFDQDRLVPIKGMIEPISGREIEVLELISAGLSNREICSRLHISVSTVKGHTANIYGKLGVKSRTQAVSEAIRLGILKR